MKPMTERTISDLVPEEVLTETDEGTTAGEPLLSTILGQDGVAANGGPRLPITGVVVGTLAGLDASGGALVGYPGNRLGRILPARSTVPLVPADVGREAALMFENGDPARPIVIGLIQHLELRPEDAKAGQAGVRRPSVEGEADRERLVLSADKEIVLRCGEASITLTRAGKVLIRGAYLLSRSSGVNRIQGGSIELN